MVSMNNHSNRKNLTHFLKVEVSNGNACHSKILSLQIRIKKN
jgi:hypothetical protein